MYNPSLKFKILYTLEKVQVSYEHFYLVSALGPHIYKQLRLAGNMQ